MSLPGFVIGLLAVPVIEILVAVFVAQAIGWLPTIVLLLAGCAAGEMVLRRSGRRAGQRVGAALRAGREPGAELSDGALLMLGGVLLLIPGFVTDVVAVPLLVPPTRRALRGWLSRRVPVVGLRRTTGSRQDDVIEGEVVDDRPTVPPAALDKPEPRDLGG